MRSRDRVGLMATVLAPIIFISCAETPRPAAPPPAPRPVATQDRPAMTQERPQRTQDEELAADEMQLIREKLRADKKLLVSMNMELTEPEAEKFWPIYDSYQTGLDRIVDRQLGIIETFARNYESMSDAIAKQLLEDYMTLEDDRFALRQSYLPKFRGVLSERKVTRYYQIENKIQAIVDMDLAANIPLVQ